MNTDLWDFRARQFAREFPTGTETERTTYLLLRDSGDTHTEAAETAFGVPPSGGSAGFEL